MDDTKVNLLLVASYAAAALVDVLAPLLLAFFIARRYRGRWRYWAYGLLVFLLSQVLTRVPVMIFLQTRPWLQEGLKRPTGYWAFLLLAASTAGLFEEGGRWLAFRWAVPPEDRRWPTALMLGAGHGGLESIGVGLLALAAMIGYLAVTLLPPETFAGAGPKVEEARKQFDQLQGWEPLLGGWERLGALAIQVGLAVMVLQAFIRGPHWWWLAVSAHTLVDFTTPALLRFGTKVWGKETGLLATEGLVGVYALLALWFIAAMRPEREGPATQMPVETFK